MTDLLKVPSGAEQDIQTANTTYSESLQQELLQFLQNCPSAFHTAHTIRRI